MEDYLKIERYKKRYDCGVYRELWDLGLGRERYLGNYVKMKDKRN